MKTIFTVFFTLLGGVSCSESRVEVSTMPCQIQVYTTAHQVDQYLSSPESREKVLTRLSELGITKIYLETVRSGYKANPEVMLASRDFLRGKGIDVSSGIATLPGPDYGIGSNSSQYAMNYEAPETRTALRETIEFYAKHFDEIIVDDFLMTDDASEKSVKARGNQPWPEYRLDLMTTIARDVLIGPAKRVNPNVNIINKFPQWYDRFHVYGYNVISGPELFDKVWVGTETRNPDTERFGYVQPTEGFINYSWLASLAKEKTGGAWFDALDCTPEGFLMQGYQSVLAGAREIIVFNLGELMESNPVLDIFWRQLDALKDVARVVNGRKCMGLCAYKPPHSEPGRDSYLFDYLATLGIPIGMTGIAPEKPMAILLSSHAATDPEIVTRLQSWLDSGVVVIITPGFLEKAGSKLPSTLFSFPKNLAELQTSTLKIGNETLQLTTPLTFLKLPLNDWKALASFQQEGEEIPILAAKDFPTGGKAVLLNISTFAEDVFNKEELFLAPKPLAIPHWPKELANAIREQIPLPVPLHVDAAPPFGLYLYGTDTLAIANFQAQDLLVKVSLGNAETIELTVPAWEVVTKSF